jgi:hypothetical protein
MHPFLTLDPLLFQLLPYTLILIFTMVKAEATKRSTRSISNTETEKPSKVTRNSRSVLVCIADGSSSLLLCFQCIPPDSFSLISLVCRMMSPIDDRLGPWLPRREQRPPKLMLIPHTRMETLVFDGARVSRRSEISITIAPLDKIPLERS